LVIWKKLGRFWAVPCNLFRLLLIVKKHKFKITISCENTLQKMIYKLNYFKIRLTCLNTNIWISDIKMLFCQSHWKFYFSELSFHLSITLSRRLLLLQLCKPIGKRSSLSDKYFPMIMKKNLTKEKNITSRPSSH